MANASAARQLETIRCRGKHPRIRNSMCGAKLAEALPGTVGLEGFASLSPGFVLVRCGRCGTDWVLCPSQPGKVCGKVGAKTGRNGQEWTKASD